MLPPSRSSKPYAARGSGAALSAAPSILSTSAMASSEKRASDGTRLFAAATDGGCRLTSDVHCAVGWEKRG